MLDERNGAEYWTTDEGKIMERVPPGARTTKRIRTVGALDFGNYTLRITRTRPNHWHRAKMGWGFNEFVLLRCREFGFSVIHLAKAYHPTFGTLEGYVPVTALLTRVDWKAGVSSQAGFEPQVFIETRDVYASVVDAKKIVRRWWTMGGSVDKLIQAERPDDRQLFLGLHREAP